jgi:hypothetical protein
MSSLYTKNSEVIGGHGRVQETAQSEEVGSNYHPDKFRDQISSNLACGPLLCMAVRVPVYFLESLSPFPLNILKYLDVKHSSPITLP